MRTICGTILAAVVACASGASGVGDPIPAAKMPETKHVFSMSCKVTACNGDLATAEGRAKAVAWWKKNHITKLWLESYRHGEKVASERLAELRDAFRAEGLEVCGMITPTMMNDTEPGKKEPRMVVCWSDPKARERIGEECARAARIFDTVILDDFLFSSCGDGCARCRADKAARQIADWGEYKRTLMYEVCERDILPAVKSANPKSHFIIKYPCWYRNYAKNGYSPARQAELFGECWIGTETRDANPEPLQACWIAAWMDSITHGRCGGGWYDALDCSPDKFIEQARYTILGGMKESLVHCYDYLLADDPGRTPFGEKAKSPRACAEAFERESGNLAALAELVRGAERGKFEMLPCGVSRHEFRKDGKDFAIYLNTKGKAVAYPEANLTFAPHELRVVGREDAIIEHGANSTLADFTQYVLPLMGSDSSPDFSTGNTYPAVGRPNGMHLWTLQTGKNGSGWIYAYNDHKVRGIRQTHAPSPWINDHGAWSFLPLVRDAVDESGRASWFSHKAETFEPHRLKVYLAEDDTTVELAATERAAIARIVYPETDTPYFVVDAFGKDTCVKVDAAARRITGESTFFHRGRLPDGFKNRFVLEFDRDFVAAGGEGASLARIKFAPTKRDEVVTVKIASSYISFDQAERNLCELGDGDFSRIVAEGRTAWNERLGRIRVEGAVDDMRKFYTCLYRTQLFPLSLHEYGADGNPVHRNPDTARVEKGVYYAGTGFWDTFRALFPLLNFVYPDVNAKMTEALRNCWRECGWLPEWSGPGIINCMIGNNSASVVADACLTPGVVSRETAEDLYKALLHGANAVKEGNDSCGRAGWELYNRLGYVPRDAKIAFSAARTLEYAYDDWCIWRLGVALGRPREETDIYLKRSGNWRNLFNPEYGLMCGRASDGSFDADFNPFEWGVDFIEGCSWHYTWSVFHDIGALAEAMGGKAAFAKKLDDVFSLPPVFCGYGGQTIHEMREMQVAGFGQYAHGNQPIQHAIYLYDWTDEPHKAQYWAREAMDRLYKPAPDGYCGDEDNGQTSAWFVWSALGMYPVCPASGEYALGTPLFEKASIHFPNGSRLVIAAPGVSAKRRYVKRVALNGNQVQGNFLKSADLRGGGELRFEMAECAGCGKKEWISGGSAAPESPAPVLSKSFTLDAIPQRAELTLAVAGWHELSINGRRVGDDVLSPVTCQPDKRLSSVAYDVTPFLKKGENVVEVLLGNGWFNCFTKDVWGFSSAPWLGAPKVCGELVADGKRLLATDETWMACDSPIVFNALRNGEYYDARREGVRASVRAVKVEDALAVAVSPEDAVPCRAFDPIPPARSFPAANGGTIYDFGSNRTGWCEIEVVGEVGSKVTIDYDECLTPTNTLLGDIGIFIRRNNDPRPAQHDEYTLAGKDGRESWHPRFTYHGFRYAQVRTEGKVELKSIKSVFVHSDFDSVGSFKISDPVFEKLQDATRRSYLSNFTGIPTDCPHREKNGWTGDAQLAMETGLWNFDAKAGYIHFLRMMIDAQKESGAVSIINPASVGWGYGSAPWPAWDAALFEIPWQIYRFYGDDAPAREAYPAMKKYLSFVGGKVREDGLVKHGLGDWCAPTGVKVAPVLLTDSAYVYEFYRRVAFWAERFGESDFAAECRKKAAKVKAAFNKEFYKGDGVYAEGELTSLAAPLYFKGLCADGEERKVADELLRRVRENGHKAMFGILGAKWIPRVLADYGHIDDAWRIFTQPDAPGWAIWMKDNDTLLESFDDTAGGTPVSHNHIMFGDLSAWAFEYLAGIKIDDPGFAKWHAEPHLPNGVESFEATFRTPCGRKISVRAWREGGEAKYAMAECESGK